MKPNEKLLSLIRLKELVSYNSVNGLFTWLVARPNVMVGDVAGCRNKLGYIFLTLDGRKYLAHRVAWFYYYGIWPSKLIDHEDEVRHHNWIKNLREANHHQNLVNSTNRKGRIYPKGVSRNGAKYCARLQLNRKYIWLGNFKTIQESSAAYVEASKKYHGKFSIYSK